MPSSCKPVPEGTPDEAPGGQVWICLASKKQTWNVRSEACHSCELCILVYMKSLMYEEDVLISAEAVHDPEAEITW